MRSAHPTALATITAAIGAHWSTGGGRRLRQFVWSLWNGYHLCNLLDITSGLDAALGDAVSVIFHAAVCGALTDAQKERVLTDSGEMARWEQAERETPEGEAVLYPGWPVDMETLAEVAASARAAEHRREAP